MSVVKSLKRSGTQESPTSSESFSGSASTTFGFVLFTIPTVAVLVIAGVLKLMSASNADSWLFPTLVGSAELACSAMLLLLRKSRLTQLMLLCLGSA